MLCLCSELASAYLQEKLAAASFSCALPSPQEFHLAEVRSTDAFLANMNITVPAGEDPGDLKAVR